MLRASGICKSYGKRRIIEQAEFFAGRGSCVGVVGANGCGKTTLYLFWPEPGKPIGEV